MDFIYTLLYVSEASNAFQRNPDINSIFDVSVRWNESVGITGALIYSGEYFSQYLEGSMTDVQYLMEKIRRDERHHSIEIVETCTKESRLFPDWSLAYAGKSEFVQEELLSLFIGENGEEDGVSASARMINLMTDLVAIRKKFGTSIH
jgi:hypothetical protein